MESGEWREYDKTTLFRIYKIHRNSFEIWLLDNKSQDYSRDLIRCCDELFTKNLTLNNIKLCIEENKYSKKYSVIGFRNFLNYCEEYEVLDLDLITRFRSKVQLNIKSNIDSFVPTKEQINRSLDIVSKKYPQYLVLYQIMIESGIRYTELKDFILNHKETNIEIYDNIALYRNFYLRGKKSSYYIFMTKNTYTKLDINAFNNKNLESFRYRIVRTKEIISLKYLRKYTFTLMIENGISFEIANFIHGRTSQNVGFNHYLSKKTIAVKEYEKIIYKF